MSPQKPEANISMWNFIKKWWLLTQFRKEVIHHTDKSSPGFIEAGGEIIFKKDFLIQGNNTKEYPGIARKSIRRFSWLFRWRRTDNLTKLRKRVREYNGIVESCIKEGYLDRGPSPTNYLKKGPKFDEMNGHMSLLQGIYDRYGVAGKIIIFLAGTLAAFLTGLNWGEIWEYISSFVPTG